MNINVLKHIERAMELIENADQEYRKNALWRGLQFAQNVWYQQKAKREYDAFIAKYKETANDTFRQIAEENYSYYTTRRRQMGTTNNEILDIIDCISPVDIEYIISLRDHIIKTDGFETAQPLERIANALDSLLRLKN